MEYFARANQLLKDHLSNVSNIAFELGKKFNMPYLCKLIGLSHDLAKYNPEWQIYLNNSLNNIQTNKVPHSEDGAIIFRDIILNNINEEYKKEMEYFLPMLCNIIYSHHGHLHDDIINDYTITYQNMKSSWYKGDYNNVIESEIISNIVACIPNVVSELKFFRDNHKTNRNNYVYHILSKMIYSTLIDGDRCDAGQFVSSNNYTIDELLNTLEEYCSNFSGDSEINKVRCKIRNTCVDVAINNDRNTIYGLYSPTGSGKTISTLSFALNHAKVNKLDRIIYVVPFLTIMDQTESVYKSIFKDKFSSIVVEDYSSSDMKMDKTYIENWDKPIIMTTMVNFLNTIMSAKGSELRKLHNISNSCIIFDEIQQLPLNCISNFNAWVNDLSSTYGVTSLICTATQPCLHNNKFNVFLNMSEKNANIVNLSENDIALFDNRCEYIDMTSTESSMDEIANFVSSRMSDVSNFLVVMNTKRESRDLYANLISMVSDCDIVLLNTDFTKEDRNKKIDYIRSNINNKNKKIICISTNMIEAGVDMSFDEGIRLCGGEDNIIQTAGRINRHGSMKTGKLYIFRLANESSSSNDNYTIVGDIFDSKQAFLDNRCNIKSDIGSKESIDNYYSIYYFGIGKSTNKQINTNLKSEFEINNTTAYKYLNNTDNETYMRKRIKGKNMKIDYTFQYDTVSNNFFVIDDTLPVFVCNTNELKKLWDSYYDISNKINDNNDRDKNKQLYGKLKYIIKKMSSHTVSVNKIKERYLSDFESVNGIYVDFDNEHYSSEFGLILDR